MITHADWSWQQLAELLAGVAGYTDERSAIEGALELAAVAVDAEVGAVLTGGEVRATLGFRRGRAPHEALLDLAERAPETAEVPGIGRCAVTVVPLEDDPPGVLLLAREGDAFDAAEQTLVHGMCRVLILALRPLRLLEVERGLRREGQAQAAANAQLLADLRARQAFLERLTDIQHAISRRQPIQQVLDAIALGVAECIGDEVVNLRVIDEEDPELTYVAAGVGAEGLGAATATSRAWSGISGHAITTGALVVAEDYALAPRARAELVEAGVRSSMATPVHRNGVVAGALVVATRNRRRYPQEQRQALEVFAEHVSLALNDASAQRTMRRAYDDAVRQARHDALTGLPNRTQVLEQLDAHIGGGVGGAVVFIDLDRFKAINDSLGHAVGDEVLVALAGRLLAAVRPGDVVGRLAGDEFVAVCPGLDAEDAVGLAERLAATVAEPLVLGDRRVVVTASVGVSTAVGDVPGEDVLRDADSAMYRAKEHGSGRVEVFDAAMRTQALERLDLEQALRTAGVDGELELHYQPILDARTGTPWAVEALLRWDRAGVGAVRPGVFIPVAEETGLIEPIGTWAIETACAEVARWRRECAPLAALRLNVNLSANQLASPALVATVAHALAQTGLPGAALFLELTESALMRDVERSGATLAELRQLGVRLSIDDFGTGYSSLVYLKRFVVSELKIDRSFVGGLGADAEDDAIVRAVIGLAHSLRLRAVAEGVVTVAQLAALRQLGCDAVQGFLLCRPAPAAGALAWLQEAATGGTGRPLHALG